MVVFFLKRSFSLLLTLAGMSMIIFIITRALPGDPAVMAAGGSDATPEMIKHVRQELGLDRPLMVQYSYFLARLLQGDFGRSFVTNRRIAKELKAHLPASVELALGAVAISCLLGIPLGVVASRCRRRLAALIRCVSIFSVAMPVYWSGLMAILIFYGILNLLPAAGRLSQGVPPPSMVTGLYLVDSLLSGQLTTFWDACRHLLLPAVILSAISFGTLINVTRSSMVEILREQFIVTARAKGLAAWVVTWKHAFRNIAIPIVTLVGLQLGQLLGGVVLVETIFAWPGLGLYVVSAIDNLDYPIIMVFTLTYSFFYAAINFVVDSLYFYLNPQITQ